MAKKNKRPLLACEDLPKDTAIHALTDYLELLCLQNTDKYFTRADFMDRIRERADVEDAPSGETMAGEELEAVQQDGAEVQHRDGAEALAASVFEHIAYRMGAFGSGYPFRLNQRAD